MRTPTGLSAPLGQLFILLAITHIAILSSSVHARLHGVIGDPPNCEDDPSFRWHDDDSKDCDWIGSLKRKRRKKICRKKANQEESSEAKVNEFCPDACRVCKRKKKCPKVPPDNGTSCAAYKEGLECPYNYAYAGCRFESGFTCEPLRWNKCEDDGTWSTILQLLPPCLETFDPNPPPQGQTCEPCPTVRHAARLKKKCPTEAPRSGSSCDTDVTCEYDFRITGCSEPELQCTTGNSFDCVNGAWEQNISNDEPCLQPDEVSCPEKEPTMGVRCRNDGLQCFYEYQNTSCDEANPSCTPTKTYTCNGSWILAVPGFWCPDGFPPNFSESCIPPEQQLI